MLFCPFYIGKCILITCVGLSDTERLTYSALPRDSGVGEGSWAGLCFSPNQWSTVVQLYILPHLYCW